MKTLLTQSLLAAWQYQYDCAEGQEEAAQAAFLRALRREPSETSDAMLAGRAFEAECYAAARQDFDEVPAGAALIGHIIRGGQFQVPLSADITVGGDDYHLYGIADAIKAGYVYDIKYKTASMNGSELAGSYLDSPQHLVYLYCLPDALDFVYLVSDGDSLYTEEYSNGGGRAEEGLRRMITEFRQDIRERGLDGIYMEKWARG